MKVALSFPFSLVQLSPTTLKQLRRESMLTQEEAAELVGVAVRTWQQWEAGDRKMHQAFGELFQLKLRLGELVEN